MHLTIYFLFLSASFKFGYFYNSSLQPLATCLCFKGRDFKKHVFSLKPLSSRGWTDNKHKVQLEDVKETHCNHKLEFEINSCFSKA